MPASPRRLTASLLLFLAASAAAAQTGAPAPPAPPAPTRPAPALSPTLAQSRAAAEAAFQACAGFNIAVAVLNAAGEDKLILAQDGTPGRFASFARRKAMTAILFGKPSGAVRDAARTDPALAARLAGDPALIGFAGGLPVTRAGQSFGAVAVSGGKDQDMDVACATRARDLLERG